MSHCPRKGVRVTRTKPDWRMWLLEWLRLHRRVFQLPELAVERHKRLGPERLHQPQALDEPTHKCLTVDTKSAEGSEPAARTDPDFQAAATQLIQRAEILGKVHGAVQARDKYHATQPQAVCTRRGKRHCLQRAEHWHSPEH